MTITFGETSSGVACDLNSLGYKVLSKATEEVVGYLEPYSITGSLPLIRDLQVCNFFQMKRFDLLEIRFCNSLFHYFVNRTLVMMFNLLATVKFLVLVVSSISFLFLRQKFSHSLNEYFNVKFLIIMKCRLNGYIPCKERILSVI